MTKNGIMWLSGALFLHFHYFWPTLKRLSPLSELGKLISAISLISSLGYVIWYILKS